jgi:hypothetical protein
MVPSPVFGADDTNATVDALILLLTVYMSVASSVTVLLLALQLVGAPTMILPVVQEIMSVSLSALSTLTVIISFGSTAEGNGLGAGVNFRIDTIIGNSFGVGVNYRAGVGVGSGVGTIQ